MTRPSLSVVVPNYNHAAYLPRCVDSVLAQSRLPDEIVLLDDASTDNSLEVMEALARREPRIRVVRNAKNQGVIASLNRLLELSSGDYILSVGADDRVLPGFLEGAMALLERHPRAGLCTALTRVVDADGSPLGLAPSLVTATNAEFVSREEARRLVTENSDGLNANATVFRRDALIAAGGFIPELRYYCDGFAALVLLLTHGGCFLAQPGMEWRKVPSGYSLGTSSDRKAYLDTVLAASRLMDSRFRDVFPRGYARRWAGGMWFEAGRAIHAELRRKEDELLALFREIAPDGARMLRLLQPVLALIFRLQSLATWGYLLLVLGYVPRAALRRRLARLRGAS